MYLIVPQWFACLLIGWYLFMLLPVVGLEEELVDCSGGEDINLEAGTQRKLQALMQVSLTAKSFISMINLQRIPLVVIPVCLCTE